MPTVNRDIRSHGGSSMNVDIAIIGETAKQARRHPVISKNKRMHVNHMKKKVVQEENTNILTPQPITEYSIDLPPEYNTL